MSASQFGDDFRQQLEMTGSTAGFSGQCWAPWLWFDLDREELHYAYKDAGGLVGFLSEHFSVPESDLLVFFSGANGFHIGVPTALWSPEPSKLFHRTTRRFAEHIAELATVTIDTGVYDIVRAFRAPNSRHPKTGLHKRYVAPGDIGLPLSQILELAREPAPFAISGSSATSTKAAEVWQAATEQVTREVEAESVRRMTRVSPRLHRSTLAFIQEGASVGDRHRLLFSAAANLGEFGCPPSLAFALLEEAALDSGLPPKDVRRQIECGLADAPLHTNIESEEVPRPEMRTSGNSLATATSEPMAGLSEDMPRKLAQLWDQPRQATNFTADTGERSLEPPPTARPRPNPPPTARIYCIDKKMRPCRPDRCDC